MGDVDYATLVEETAKATPPDVSKALVDDCLRHALAAARRGETTLTYPVQDEALVRGLEEAVSSRSIPVTSDRQSVTLSWGK